MDKRAKIGVAIGASSILMLTSAYAAMADSSGYDAYKAAIKQTHAANSMTGNFDVTISDNGKQVAELVSTTKMNHQTRQGSSNITLKSPVQTETVELYRQPDKSVIKTSTSDVYNVIETNGNQMRHMNKFNQDTGHQQDVENVIDTLFKNLDNYMTVDAKGDGSKEISLQMSEGQVPAAANAVGSMLLKQAAEHHERMNQAQTIENPIVKDAMGFKDQLPKLTQDIQIKQIHVTAEVNKDNYIDSQQANVVISGKDAAGQSHEVVIQVQADLSQFNNTTVDNVDLTGKTVKTISPQDMRNHHKFQ